MPEIDRKVIDQPRFETHMTVAEDRSVSTMLEVIKEPLPSPIFLRTRIDVGETTMTSPLQSAIEKQPARSWPTAHTRIGSRISQHFPGQAISRGSKRHSACLDVVLEADDERLDEPQNAEDIGVGTGLKNRLEEQLREQVAKNRVSFWDTLSDEQSHSSQHSLDFKDALRLSPSRPHKLRKRKYSTLADRIVSAISLSTTACKERAKNKVTNRAHIVGTPDMVSPQGSARLDLPNGVVQTGQGIGFNYSLGPAALSKASLCSTTPRICHAMSLKGLPRLARKAKGTKGYVGEGSASPMPPETDHDKEMTAVMKEIYGSTWTLGMSAVNVSQPLAYATASSPLSTLAPGSQIPGTPEFAEADEVVAGDPDTTLRLVFPTSPSE